MPVATKGGVEQAFNSVAINLRKRQNIEHEVDYSARGVWRGSASNASKAMIVTMVARMKGAPAK